MGGVLLNRLFPSIKGGSALFVLAVLPLLADGSGVCWTDEISKPGLKLAVMTLTGEVTKGTLAECTPVFVSLSGPAGVRQLGRHEVAVLRVRGAMGDYHTVYAPWSNLSELGQGQEVRVVFPKQADRHGVLKEVREDGITILRKGRMEFIEKPSIQKVRVLAKNKRDTAAQVGATAGFLAAILSLGAAVSGAGGATADFGNSSEILELTGAAAGKAGQEMGRMFDVYQTIYVAPGRK